ncbi:beta-galactosidase 13-like [Juglans microcarpa x Juglans regia]|uniref:beta-galactosidase 13-like n=1 Tax=Juglans microcarpa x Juglans regia TaxID=2249226 RepID=UPI001B7DA6B1|nr:beta-galactosidase 13-like [Juglans microcarpa x Juglans regia]
MAVPSRVLLLAVLSLLLVSVAVGHGEDKFQNVTYDGRSLIINGKRELLFSGSIHYTRSTPEMWPDLIAKAKHGGLNVIQTYVFWNIHEPVEGQFNFNGNYDLVKFIKLIGEQGMYVTLRIGPFIQAEWNHGGIPYWLREVPDIIFRSNNGPFKQYMKKYAKMIIDKMKEEKLFASQGGPIILSQIENEYNHIQLAYRDMGSRYVQWAAKMAVGLNTEVPWIMCKQKDAPDPVINTCNGRHCGDTFTGPNKPHKPSLWTENWTAQYRVFGDPPSQRAAEDIAFSVARFFSKNGTLVNYYMYHGGTNFGRTSAVFTTTRYYDEAPIDEYGLQREPKWSHLKDVHKALNLCKKPLLWGEHGVQILGKHTEAQLFEIPGTKVCAAFLANNNSKSPETVDFRGEKYYLPPRSISILPDCKTVVFNTQTIVSQHNARNLKSSKVAKNLKWEMSSEPIPTVEELPVDSKTPKELYSFLKDTTDYAWYTTSIELGPRDLPMRPDIHPVLRVASLGHALHAFVNGEYVGSAHGSHDEKSFVFQNAVNLKAGVNHIALIGMTVGLPDSGAYMEHRYAGPRAITVLGLNTGTLDLTVNGWGHQVGLTGEKMKVFTQSGSHRVEWKKADGQGRALTWYKTYFDAPEGNDPVAIRMTGMGKGMIWVNGKSIGRHWMSFLSPLGKPSQSDYHIPRSFIKPTENLLVVLEEEKGNPEDIEILLVNRNTICSVITEYHPPHVKSWQRKESKIRPVVDTVKPAAQLKCPNHQEIVAVEFASYGDPYGSCGSFLMGNCNAPITKEVVEQNCLGKTSCSVPIERELFIKDNDACPDIMKTLAIQVKCDHKKH